VYIIGQNEMSDAKDLDLDSIIGRLLEGKKRSTS